METLGCSWEVRLIADLPPPGQLFQHPSQHQVGGSEGRGLPPSKGLSCFPALAHVFLTQEEEMAAEAPPQATVYRVSALEG